MCIELNVGATQGPMNWNVQTTTASASLLKQLALGLNGGQQLATSAEYKEIGPASFVADWVFTLEPNKRHYLLISNTAAQPGSTKRQDVEIRITLAGRTPAVAKPPPKAAKKSRPSEQPKPGPAGAEAAQRLLQDQMQGGTNGAGSVSWNYEAGGNCSPQATWRFDCEGGISLSLGMNLGGNSMAPPSAGASGDMLSQILSATSIDMQDVARMEQYLDETAGTSISLGIPGVDYGFTGTVNDVAIEVSGTPDQRSRGSWSTRATTEWSPCSYQPPNGTVTITEFSRTLLRGTYRGQLVEAGSSRPGWKEKCPVKPVVGTIEGEFIIPAPWKHDDREEMQVDWLKQYIADDIQQMLPPGIDFDIQIPTDGSAPASGTSPAGGGDPFDALENLSRDDCACTTKERDEGMQAMQRIMMGGVTEPKPEDLRLTMCVQLCLAE
jgi:hypothetical protein